MIYYLSVRLLTPKKTRSTSCIPAAKCTTSTLDGPWPEKRPSRCLWQGVLRTPSYFAANCDAAPIEISRQYIKQQQTPGQIHKRQLGLILCALWLVTLTLSGTFVCTPLLSPLPWQDRFWLVRPAGCCVY